MKQTTGTIPLLRSVSSIPLICIPFPPDGRFIGSDEQGRLSYRFATLEEGTTKLTGPLILDGTSDHEWRCVVPGGSTATAQILALVTSLTRFRGAHRDYGAVPATRPSRNCQPRSVVCRSGRHCARGRNFRLFDAERMVLLDQAGRCTGTVDWVHRFRHCAWSGAYRGLNRRAAGCNA